MCNGNRTDEVIGDVYGLGAAHHAHDVQRGPLLFPPAREDSMLQHHQRRQHQRVRLQSNADS